METDCGNGLAWKNSRLPCALILQESQSWAGPNKWGPERHMELTESLTSVTSGIDDSECAKEKLKEGVSARERAAQRKSGRTGIQAQESDVSTDD
ncbi:hypothetical protein A6R68_19062 [Neotoma lepida]|uniref:Uncharacterized protein n=1 Tax=Neotoma lepida TaxID=56216 RepID=A0A1A6HJ11_NEOLE|nr:hypothetical protein A6R68_19062 [Neotoma lepida]